MESGKLDIGKPSLNVNYGMLCSVSHTEGSMLREAQTGTEGHVIGVDETCGVCSSGLGVYCDRSRFRFKVPKAKGVCLFIR